MNKKIDWKKYFLIENSNTIDRVKTTDRIEIIMVKYRKYSLNFSKEEIVWSEWDWSFEDIINIYRVFSILLHMHSGKETQ